MLSLELTLGRQTIGIAMAFLNCIMSSIGFTMQRKAYLMQNNGEHDDVEQQQRARSKRASQVVSLAGMVLYILAAVPDVIAYSLVPQVVCVAVAFL
mmetsp:Transcript_41635/g.93500  ORF Transcript_41635/g.93500 Transcript_41635/m.93500 type:complete len:96 (-) Transcript_41635:23-310(-)